MKENHLSLLLFIPIWLIWLVPKNTFRESQKSYFDIYQIGDKVKYKSTINGAEKSIVYESSARLPKFEVEPLTCLAFSQNNSVNSCSLKNFPF